MKSHMVPGGGGALLHVVETGNARGRPIVFIHGFSQCWRCWRRQLDSELADSHRLVAMDLRGHGHSDRPREGYGDSGLWADDVNAVIKTLDLDHPVLCGWSYGPLVILDYIRRYGDGDIGGANFVGGVTKLGSEDAASVLTPEFLHLVPGFFSAEPGESMRALDSLLRLCFARKLAAEDHYLLLGCSVSVPSYVREAMFARSLDNDDLLPQIGTPVLVTHGANDAVVKLTVNDQQMARIPKARFVVMENAGHGCFHDDAAEYNRCLSAFAESL